jgi:hypothetical protein
MIITQQDLQSMHVKMALEPQFSDILSQHVVRFLNHMLLFSDFVRNKPLFQRDARERHRRSSLAGGERFIVANHDRLKQKTITFELSRIGTVHAIANLYGGV